MDWCCNFQTKLGAVLISLSKMVSGALLISRNFAQNKKKFLASSCLSVCPHVTVRLLLPEIRYLRIFPKSVEKIQVSLKSGKIIGHDNVNSQLDATMTNFIDNYNQLNMFGAMISPITAYSVKHR